MILDNLSRALKTQNWLAAALEFIIVLAGVVIGFQINAFAEARADRERETLLLTRLQADFSDLRASAAEATQDCTSRRDNALSLSALLANAPQEDEAVLTEALGNAIGTPVPTGRSATYVELLASGEMALIGSETLRSALVKFDERVRMHELAYESLSTLTISNAAIMFETISMAGSPSAERLSEDITTRFASAELAAASQMMAIVNARNCYWFESVQARAESVLAAMGDTP